MYLYSTRLIFAGLLYMIVDKLNDNISTTYSLVLPLSFVVIAIDVVVVTVIINIVVSHNVSFVAGL